jgi:putative DNA modification/repair radical SAM protein
MERMMLVAKKLRIEEQYNGYIHLKTIPGASPELVHQAGLYADRLSVNIEIPTEQQLLRLAPEKNYKGILTPMKQIKEEILTNKEEQKKFRKALLFTPAGQSTQMIVGATPESDRQILLLSSGLYKSFSLKRVYYSGYLPVNEYDKRLPALSAPPLARENRLYQCDWLMRFYHYQAEEILDESQPFLDLDLDPKLAYAIRHPHLFPIDVNRADYEMILRVPGIGVKSAQMIVYARRFRRLTSDHLKKIGVVMKRAKYFITCNELPWFAGNIRPELLRKKILAETESKWRQPANKQLSLFNDFTLLLPPSH